MARTEFFGFETASVRAEANQSAFGGSGMAFDNTIARTGAYSLKAAAVSGASGVLTLLATTGDFVRAYVRVTARPASTARVIYGATGGNSVNLRLNPNGTIAYYQGVTLVGTSTTALTDTSRWYRVEWRGGTAASGTVLQIDDVVEVTAAPSAWPLTSAFGPNDTVADTYTVYFDDVARDNAAFPGDGNVALLVPISDSSVGAGWQKPGGTTTGLSTSVDDTPPIGVADSTSGTNAEKQIRNASSAASSYVATMTSYATAGVGASDTINAVQSFVAVGAPVSTGAKTGSQQITANPAAASATAFAANSGQFWTGAAAGTFPTGWKLERAAAVNAPSVTIASSPTLSLNITGGTASRVADCCFMGMYVDYTPAGVAPTTSLPPLRRDRGFRALLTR